MEEQKKNLKENKEIENKIKAKRQIEERKYMKVRGKK